MSIIRLRLEGAEKVMRKLRDGAYDRQLRVFLGSVGAHIEGGWKSRVSVDTGRYRASITHKVESSQRVVIGSNVKYAVYREFGTRPHWPPLDAMQPWARRHGFPSGRRGAFLVARAIARRGTKAEKALERTVKSSRVAFEGFLKRLARDIGTEWER